MRKAERLVSPLLWANVLRAWDAALGHAYLDYSILFAGDFFKESGPSSDMHWFYFQTVYRF